MTGDKLGIFVSSGTPYNEMQKQFIAGIEAHLQSHGCQPQTVGRNTYSGRQPVEAARDLITRCDGAVVIALERVRILHALDRPGTEQQEIRNESHPTIWNQMEAAMAYAWKVPLLILVEKGLRRQGMLSDRLEWKAIETDVSLALLSTEEFQQVFKEWMTLVKARGKQPAALNNADGKWKVRDIVAFFGNLKAADAWALCGAIFAILAAVAVAAYTVGQWTDGGGGTKKSAIDLPTRQAVVLPSDYPSRVSLSAQD